MHEQQTESKFRSLARKIMGRDQRVAPDAEATTRAVIAEFHNQVASPERSRHSDSGKRLSQTAMQNHAGKSR